MSQVNFEVVYDVESIISEYCRFIPPGQGDIEMTDNVGYEARPSGVQNNVKSPESDNFYEELPCGIDEEAYSNLDQDHTIESSHQQSVDKEDGTNDDEYYVNDDLFPEKSEKEQAAGGEMKDNDEYYVNDDLFPKQDEEEDHTSVTSARVKDSSGDGDYYVNDDLFPNSTTAQAAHNSNHSDEEIAS